jgi:hypothetical protein
MQLDISDKFVAQCSPVIDTNYDTCGTITRSSIAHLDAGDLDTLFLKGGLFADLDAWLFHSIEMKACGIRRYAWYDWIMANADRTMVRSAISPGQKVMKGESLMHPFIIANQVSIVNKDFWKVTNGWAGSAYDALNSDLALYPLTNTQLALGTDTDRVIRIESRHGIPMAANWFRVRDVLYLFNSSASGISQQGNWRVLASAADEAGTFTDVLVRSENGGSTGYWDTAPTAGFLIPGINNVNDFERWCSNKVNLDPRKKVLFFYQYFRDARCVSDAYDEVYARLLTANPAFKEFGDLPMAQRNAEDELDSQKRFVNAFFFQKALPNQNKDDWESLEAIYSIPGTILDPMGYADSPELVARRANFEGVFEQLRKCDRTKDLKRQPLNLYEFLDDAYNIARARKSTGKKVTSLDYFTNSVFAANFQTAYVNYIDNEFGGKEVFNIEQGKLSEAGMTYDSYIFKRPANVRINIITDEFFDDFYDENLALNQEAMGNLLLCLEIGKPGPSGGSIYWGQIAANRKEYSTATIEQMAKLDSTFLCTMATRGKRQSLTSQAGTVICECPLNSLWIHNFSTAPPIVTGKSQNGLGATGYSNLY